MKNANKYWLVILCFLLATGCAEDEIELFNGKPAINIGVIQENGRTDTLRNVSFTFMEQDTVTVYFLAMLQGIPENHDRKITITLSGNAEKGTDYELNEEIILPAGAHEVRIPCLLKTSESLNGQSRTIVLTTVPDDSFDKGLVLSSTIEMSDGEPNQWLNNGMAEYTLGKCSALKYRFFYDIMGFYDLGAYYDGDLRVMATHLNNKLDEYNADLGNPEEPYGPRPMTDENGPVRFEYVYVPFPEF